MTEKDSTVNKLIVAIDPGPLPHLIMLLGLSDKGIIDKNAQNKSTGNTISHVIMESFRQNKINAEEADSLIQSHCNKGGVELNIRNNVGDTPMHILVQPASVDKETNASAAERLVTAKEKILQKLIA